MVNVRVIWTDGTTSDFQAENSEIKNTGVNPFMTLYNGRALNLREFVSINLSNVRYIEVWES